MATQELTTKESNAVVKTQEGKSTAIEVAPDRVIISLALPLRNGTYGDYPYGFSVWKNRTPDLYQKVQALKEGQEVWVKWTEKPAQRGFYRDVLAMEKPKTSAETAGASTAPADDSSEAIWESMGATKAAPPAQPPARAPTMPAVAPAHPAGGNDTQRASIEAQVAAKIASEILRDMLATVDGTPESKLPLVAKMLPELTMIARAAIHEASQT